MKYKSLLLFLALFFLLVLTCVMGGAKYSYADLKSFTDILLSVSGAIFTVMGIWIAFLYPNALSRIVNPGNIVPADFSADRSEASRLSYVVGSVLKSAFVALSIITLGIFRIIIPMFPISQEYTIIIKQFVLSFVILLYLLQASALWQVIVSNVSFLNDLYVKSAERSVEDKY